MRLAPTRLWRVTVLATALAVVAGLGVVASPAQAQRIRSDFWGMHDSDWTSAPTVRVGAANLTTSGTYWPSIENLPGVYDWTRLDEQVEAAERIGAQPMVVLGQSPQHASSQPLSADYQDHMPNLTAWRAYVSAVAQRYGTRLDYQIWPEPNIVENWRGTPRQMATLTMVASQAITKHAGRSARVVSPAVALRLRQQRRWTLQFFRQKVGGKRVHGYVDAIALDPFPAQRGAPEDAFALMRTIKKQLARIGVRRKPFWNNEINYGVSGGGTATTTSYPARRERAYVIRTYVLSAAARMQRAYWLSWARSSEVAIQMSDGTGAPTPASEAFDVVRSWLHGSNVAGCSRKKNGLWVCTVHKGREVRRIYWKPTGRAKVRTHRSARRLVTQEGRVDRTPPRRIRVTERPVMVVSRR